MPNTPGELGKLVITCVRWNGVSAFKHYHASVSARSQKESGSYKNERENGSRKQQKDQGGHIDFLSALHCNYPDFNFLWHEGRE